MCSEQAPLISVIIPAFNASPTLTDAIESVLAQDFSDFEIIVVNDGSADASSQLARDMSTRANGKLRVIDLPENRGSAVAWQTGVDNARGRYVTKLDADDTLPPRALGLLAEGTKSNARVVRGMYHRMVNEKPELFGPDPARTNLNDMPICVDYFSLCGKLIDRSLLTGEDIRAYPKLDCWEDLGVVARVAALEPLTVTIPEVVYNYWVAPKGMSLSTCDRSRLLSNHIGIAREIDRWMQQRGLADTYAEFLTHLKFAAKVKFVRGRHRRIREWQTTFPEVNSHIMRLRHVPLIYRLMFSAVALLPARLTQTVADAFDR